MELKNPIKERDAVYCNLKLFLIFLVIYGHMIEGRIYEDAVLMQIYRMIYSFHMPLFLFLSGLFLTDFAGCFRQMKKCFSSIACCSPLQCLSAIFREVIFPYGFRYGTFGICSV